MLEILLRHYIETPPGGARLARRRRDRRHRRRRGRQAAPAAGSFCAKRKPTYNVHTHMILQSADDGSAKLHNGRLVPFLNSSTIFTEICEDMIILVFSCVASFFDRKPYFRSGSFHFATSCFVEKLCQLPSFKS